MSFQEHYLHLAAIQMLPATGDPKANVERAARLVREAAREHGAELIVLPECTLTGYTSPKSEGDLAESRQLAETIPGRSVRGRGGIFEGGVTPPPSAHPAAGEAAAAVAGGGARAALSARPRS